MHSFNIYNINEVIIQAQKYCGYCGTLFEVRKVAGSAKYK